MIIRTAHKICMICGIKYPINTRNGQRGNRTFIIIDGKKKYSKIKRCRNSITCSPKCSREYNRRMGYNKSIDRAIKLKKVKNNDRR